jgi:hypothetical protein
VTQQPVRRALISVYDKTGLEELGYGLAEAGVHPGLINGLSEPRLARALVAGGLVPPAEELRLPGMGYRSGS